MIKKLCYSVFIITVLFLSACQVEKDNNRSVFVSILPQKFFVQKIAGDKFEVNVLVQPGMSPATYEPLPSQMIELERADAFFRIGVPFEDAWLSKIESNYPDLIIVDTRNNIKLREMESVVELLDDHDHGHDHDHDHHSHAEGHSHDHGGKDPHIWLNPDLVKIQAENIFNSLSELDPANKSFFEENLNLFNMQLDSVSAKIDALLIDSKDEAILVFHPSWGYFTDRFGLKQIAIEIEGKEPTPGILSEIIELVRRENIKTVFVQKQFSASSMQSIAEEINGEIVQLDPLAENYLENILFMARKIADAD